MKGPLWRSLFTLSIFLSALILLPRGARTFDFGFDGGDDLFQDYAENGDLGFSFE